MPSRFVPSSVISSALAVGLTASPALAAPPEAPAATLAPVAITLSGGASLGAYQGGLGYTLLRYFRAHRATTDPQTGELTTAQPLATEGTGRIYDVVTTTGTSAGAANALAVALTWCADDAYVGTFRNNLFRDMWMSSSIERLLPPTPEGYAPEDGLFSTHALQPALTAMVRHLYDDRILPGCTIPLGFAITRSTPARLAVGDSLEFSTSQYVASARLTAGVDSRIRFERASPRPGKLIARELVVPDHRGEIDKTHIVKTIRASTAIPTVFVPELLNHCVSAEEQPPGEGLPQAPGCPAEKPYLRQDTFVDGGIFDRVPVALAVEFVDQAPPAERWARLDPLSYLTADPMQVRWSSIEPPPPSSSSQGLAALVAFTSDFVVVARQTELLALYQQRQLDPTKEQLVQINRGFPVMGRYVGNFGATMDRGFREYDYLVGVYEALRYLAQRRYYDRLKIGGDETPGPVGTIGCALTSPPPPSSPEAVACMVPEFRAVGLELGLDSDQEASALVGELLRWELERSLTEVQARAVFDEQTGWPFTPSEAWKTSPLRLLQETLRELDHLSSGLRLGTNLSAFLEIILALKARGYPFENKDLARNPEDYLYRLARRGLARLEYLEKKELRRSGEDKTLGKRVALGAIRAASAAVPAPAAPRDALERKRTGLEVLLPNYLDFNLLQGGADVGYETRLIEWGGGLGFSASFEPLAWRRTTGLGWQGTIETGWHNQGFNRVTAIRGGAFVQSAWATAEAAELGLRVSGRFFANRVQLGVEVPLWEAQVGLPMIQAWPSRLEITVGLVDIRGITRVGGGNAQVRGRGP